MRELIFRQWYKDWRSFYYWGINVRGVVGEKYADCFKSPCLDPDFKESEQYTGRRDVKRTSEYPKGQMVFEGDIVKCCAPNSYEIETFVGTIMFCDKMGGYVISDNEDPSFRHYFWNLETIEVIGNVHQSV